MKIRVLYDNRTISDDWYGAWGFSCLIENEKKETALFDTGGNPEILKKNIEKNNVDISDLKAVLFSHSDWDHITGMEYVLSKNKASPVYVPYSFDTEIKEKINSFGHNTIDSGDGFSEIIDGVRSTPVMERWGNKSEMGLLVEMQTGHLLLTGCAHPGIEYMVKKIAGISDFNVRMVMGGFHLKGASEPYMDNLYGNLLKSGIEKIAPAHCTGTNQIEYFKDRYGDNCFEIGAGSIVENI